MLAESLLAMSQTVERAEIFPEPSLMAGIPGARVAWARAPAGRGFPNLTNGNICLHGRVCRHLPFAPFGTSLMDPFEETDTKASGYRNKKAQQLLENTPIRVRISI